VATRACLRDTSCLSKAGLAWKRYINSSHHSSLCWMLYREGSIKHKQL
jgi:hypothetical protein